MGRYNAYLVIHSRFQYVRPVEIELYLTILFLCSRVTSKLSSFREVRSVKFSSKNISLYPCSGMRLLKLKILL